MHLAFVVRHRGSSETAKFGTALRRAGCAAADRAMSLSRYRQTRVCRIESAAMLIRALCVALAFGLVVPATLAQTKPVDFVSLMGKTRAQIASVFPGTGEVVESWNGWARAYLAFNAKGRLVSVNLEPRAPISEAEAENAVRGFGVTVDRRKYVAAPAVHAYSDMNGPIKTVNYLIERGRVTTVGIFSSIGYND